MKKPFLFFIFILCGATSFSQTFTGKPRYEILTVRAGTDTLGITTVELFPEIAPLHVNNFDSLVGYQFYDSTAFHRVIPGFMIQGGDPNSRSGPVSTWGYGDSTQPTVNAEFTAARHLRGTLSAARDSDINSANSQFFICVAAASWLNGNYSVYGRVTAGMDVVDTIVSAPRDAMDNPLQKIEMFISAAGSNDSVPDAPLLDLPLDNSYGVSTVRALKWIAGVDAIMYRVQVSTDSLFSTLYKNVDVGTNAYTVTGLIPGNTYYWRVYKNNGGHLSVFSETWRFTVSSTGIDDLLAASLITVSPNPGKGLFIFSHLDDNAVVDIYDITGRKVCSRQSGNSTCNVDLSDKEKGIYFYRILVKGQELKNGKIVLQ